MHLTEDLLHFIWRKRLYDEQRLRSTTEETIQVLHSGHLNHNAGPDFLNARLRIGDLEWAGNVELHLKSSDWYAHGHHNDPAYENVLLHVVFEDDRPVEDNNGKVLPTLEIGPRIDPGSLQRYAALMSTLDDIPCHRQVGEVEPIKVRQWLDRMLIQRLERKSVEIAETTAKLNGDLRASLYQALAANFGFKVNREPFERLAEALSLDHLLKHRTQRLQVEAMLYGVAGLLHGKFTDDYPNTLKKEFAFLQKKYNLKTVETVQWRWGRIRPSGFPSVRISQFAALVCSLKTDITELLELKDRSIWQRLAAHDYWKTHCRFDVANASGHKLGAASIQNLLINTIVPFTFHLSEKRQQEELKQNAFSILEELPPEDNRIVRRWAKLGVKAANSADSQALIELRNVECQHKKCLFCGIGNEIIGAGTGRHKGTPSI